MNNEFKIGMRIYWTSGNGPEEINPSKTYGGVVTSIIIEEECIFIKWDDNCSATRQSMNNKFWNWEMIHAEIYKQDVDKLLSD